MMTPVNIDLTVLDQPCIAHADGPLNDSPRGQHRRSGPWTAL